MDLNLLKVFLSVAQEQSLTLAAQKLNTVQSNVSARLKVLESEIGQPLFLRSKKGMSLTEAGERLQPLAADLIQRANDISIELKKDKIVGHVTLGVPESFLRTYLKTPLRSWLKDHPSAKVDIKTGFSHQISADLENREIDFGVIISRQKPHQFHVLREFASQLVIVAPKAVTEINQKSLAHMQPMIVGDSCFFGQAVIGLCSELDIESRSVNYIHSIESIIHCISIGLGFTVLPKCLFEKHSQKADLSFHDLKKNRDFSFFKVCLKSRKNAKLVSEMQKYL